MLYRLLRHCGDNFVSEIKTMNFHFFVDFLKFTKIVRYKTSPTI